MSVLSAFRGVFTAPNSDLLDRLKRRGEQTAAEIAAEPLHHREWREVIRMADRGPVLRAWLEHEATAYGRDSVQVARRYGLTHSALAPFEATPAQRAAEKEAASKLAAAKVVIGEAEALARKVEEAQDRRRNLLYNLERARAGIDNVRGARLGAEEILANCEETLREVAFPAGPAYCNSLEYGLAVMTRRAAAKQLLAELPERAGQIQAGITRLESELTALDAGLAKLGAKAR